jgi:hypothetical protein
MIDVQQKRLASGVAHDVRALKFFGGDTHSNPKRLSKRDDVMLAYHICQGQKNLPEELAPFSRWITSNSEMTVVISDFTHAPVNK